MLTQPTLVSPQNSPGLNSKIILHYTRVLTYLPHSSQTTADLAVVFLVSDRLPCRLEAETNRHPAGRAQNSDPADDVESACPSMDPCSKYRWTCCVQDMKILRTKGNRRQLISTWCLKTESWLQKYSDITSTFISSPLDITSYDFFCRRLFRTELKPLFEVAPFI